MQNIIDNNRQTLRLIYHARFLLRSIFDTFLRPPLAIFLIQQTGLIRLPNSTSISVLIYGLSIPLVGVVSTVWSSRKKALDRTRLNALPIPKVKGKKMGNVDVLRALIQAEKTEYPGDIFLEWAKEYGPTFDMNILWASQIVTRMLSVFRLPWCWDTRTDSIGITVDPENVRYLLSTAFPSFEKGEKFHDMFESFWGEGIFTTDGEIWKKHRATARPFFAQERLSDFSSFERHMEKILEILEEMSGNGEAFDMQVGFTIHTARRFYRTRC